ncbi:MAG: hypothetical protein KAT26_10695, partial [Marinosulfonomonas sp.]|nr:hypothetical protein [Marinosulfonomonas sp.]
MSIASIQSVAGPVVKAIRHGPLSMGEAVHVGANRLLGEVVRLTDTGCTIQIYEDTTGLRPGDSIEGSGMPLSVKLGPGLLGNIFDGLLRPLKPDTDAVRYDFEPLVKKGDRLHAGMRFATVSGPAKKQFSLVPPHIAQAVVAGISKGVFTDDETVCT